jgi:hypothetical protein
VQNETFFASLLGIFCAETGGFGDYIQAVAIPPRGCATVAKTQHPRCRNGTMAVHLSLAEHAFCAVLLDGDWSNSLCYTHLTDYPGR